MTCEYAPGRLVTSQTHDDTKYATERFPSDNEITSVLIRPWADGGPHTPPTLLTFFGIFIYPWVCGLRKSMLTGKILGPKVPPMVPPIHAPTEAAVRVFTCLYILFRFYRFEIVALSETCTVDIYLLYLQNHNEIETRCRRLLEFYF